MAGQRFVHTHTHTHIHTPVIVTACLPLIAKTFLCDTAFRPKSFHVLQHIGQHSTTSPEKQVVYNFSKVITCHLDLMQIIWQHIAQGIPGFSEIVVITMLTIALRLYTVAQKKRASLPSDQRFVLKSANSQSLNLSEKEAQGYFVCCY